MSYLQRQRRRVLLPLEPWDAVLQLSYNQSSSISFEGYLSPSLLTAPSESLSGDGAAAAKSPPPPEGALKQQHELMWHELWCLHRSCIGAAMLAKSAVFSHKLKYTSTSCSKSRYVGTEAPHCLLKEFHVHTSSLPPHNCTLTPGSLNSFRRDSFLTLRFMYVLSCSCQKSLFPRHKPASLEHCLEAGIFLVTETAAATLHTPENVPV